MICKMFNGDDTNAAHDMNRWMKEMEDLGYKFSFATSNKYYQTIFMVKTS